MKLIFICAPFRGANPWEVSRHVVRAETMAMDVALLGAIPMVVQSMWRNFDKTITDEFWLEACWHIMDKCDAVFLSPDWEGSSGCRIERRMAIDIGIPIFQNLVDLKGWIKCQP